LTRPKKLKLRAGLLSAQKLYDSLTDYNKWVTLVDKAAHFGYS